LGTASEQLARCPRDYLAMGQDTWKDAQIALRWVRNNPVASRPRSRWCGYSSNPRHRELPRIRTLGIDKFGAAASALRIRGTSATSRLPRPRYRPRAWSSAG